MAGVEDAAPTALELGCKEVVGCADIVNPQTAEKRVHLEKGVFFVVAGS